MSNHKPLPTRERLKELFDFGEVVFHGSTILQS